MAKKIKKRKGNIPEGDRRLGMNVDEKTYKALKLATVNLDTTIGEIIEELVAKDLKALISRHKKDSK